MPNKLEQSLGTVYRLLERPRFARRVLAALLLIHTGLLAYSAYVHSPTLNEPAHLVAGLSHWKFGRFDLYRVNPPLVRLVAALPVTAAGYNEDWSGFYEGLGVRPDMSMGNDFVAANGERSFFLLMIARWACIPFSWIGVIVCFLWARDLYGRPAGVMAAAIWCFEPNILGHASLITPDTGATSLGLAACYTFWRWLKNPSWPQVLITGVVLGLAELAKATVIIFYPLWPLMWLIYRSQARKSLGVRDWVREAGMLAAQLVIGLYVLNLGYSFEGAFAQLKTFYFVSDLFTGQSNAPTPLQGAHSNFPNSQGKQLNFHPSPVEDKGGASGNLQFAKSDPQPLDNRFANSWLGEFPIPLPKNYLLGIDLQQKDFEHYGRPSYLRGEWRDHGWWYYYVYGVAIKLPVGLWALLAYSIILRLLQSTGNRIDKTPPTPDGPQPTSDWRDEFILLFPGILIFVVVSSKTGFSEHIRYVLPAFPYFFIWTGQLARSFLTNRS